MAHSANTFRDRAATYRAMKRYVDDEKALRILDRLAAVNVTKARKLEKLASPIASFTPDHMDLQRRSKDS